MVNNWFAEIGRFVLYAVLFIILLVAYSMVLQQFGIIPIGGKKAPTYVFLLFFQWWYVTRFPKRHGGEKRHFLGYFALQYLLIIITAILSAYFLYYFFQSTLGLQLLDDYIQQSLLQLNSYKEVIVSQEGGEYYNSLHAGIKSIDAYSIAKDDFAQKIALGFLPNLLISLYYKK
ncbi:hypothetical protein SKC37_04295 [Aquirufa sp. HETE-83D]|uniref:DUF4199 domain-containing protein n=1 Tax=Aquirufa esocilacus TaxID=3096513 RepID=A0ABW6DGP4_9BACT